ncbi:MAG: hypothetical protein QOE51_1505 [Actinoplanes sp.]|jgi:hypothetical protein|nr:hypothetical protein [Actinoplanes sp.]
MWNFLVAFSSLYAEARVPAREVVLESEVRRGRTPRRRSLAGPATPTAAACAKVAGDFNGEPFTRVPASGGA